MNTEEKRAIAKSFLAQQKKGVISTLHPDNGGIESAFIQVTLADDHLNIVFDCLPDSRKHQNLQNDSRVALVVGWDDNITVQIRGRAESVKNDELNALKELHLINNPTEKEFLGMGAVLYRVVPEELRYSDYRNAASPIFVLSETEITNAPTADYKSKTTASKPINPKI